MKIIINDDWYIASDILCYELHETKEHPSKKDPGVFVRGDRTTYHYTIEDALVSLCNKERLALTKDFEGTMDEYIERIHDINRDLENKIMNMKILHEIKANEDDLK